MKYTDSDETEMNTMNSRKHNKHSQDKKFEDCVVVGAVAVVVVVEV